MRETQPINEYNIFRLKKVQELDSEANKRYVYGQENEMEIPAKSFANTIRGIVQLYERANGISEVLEVPLENHRNAITESINTRKNYIKHLMQIHDQILDFHRKAKKVMVFNKKIKKHVKCSHAFPGSRQFEMVAKEYRKLEVCYQDLTVCCEEIEISLEEWEYTDKNPLRGELEDLLNASN